MTSLLVIAPLLAAATLQQVPEGGVREAMPTPRAIVPYRGSTNIAIDGLLADWPAVPPIRLDDTRQISGTSVGQFSGPQDLNAQAFMVWDERFLWFAAKVLDDFHVPLSPNTPQLTEIPPTDAITLTFDPRRDTRSIGRDERRAEDSSYWLGDQTEQTRRVLRWKKMLGETTLPEGAVCQVMRDDENGVTSYEARIPWGEIFPDRTKAAAADILDVQIIVDDFDVADDTMPETRIGWTFGTGIKIDPGLFGSILLTHKIAGDDEAIDLPELPEPPEFPEPPVLDPGYWTDFQERIRSTKIAYVVADTIDAASVGEKTRNEWLALYESYVRDFPRMDFLRFVMCTQRRMVRECAGMVETGLPFYWDHVLGRVGLEAEADSPARGFRLFRLPQGGWLVRSKVANFLIDPSGLALEKAVGRWCDFALFTSPTDMTKVHDQLVFRMRLMKEPRRPFMHMLRGIPGVTMKADELAVPGKSYEERGLKIDVLGKVDQRGWVTATVGYRVTWPDGSSLVVSGRHTTSEDVGADKPKPDVLLLSAQHAIARVFGQRVMAKCTVLDDVLQCAALPGPNGRVSLKSAFELQRGLRPMRSVILAPGESIDSEDLPD